MRAPARALPEKLRNPISDSSDSRTEMSSSTTAVAEVGFPANPRFRHVLESEIPAFENEHLPGGSGSLEESAVDQGLKGRAKIL
jgi:hypothetical protein